MQFMKLIRSNWKNGEIGNRNYRLSTKEIVVNERYSKRLVFRISSR